MTHCVSRLYLASASPRRYEILRSLGLDVTVVGSTYVECDDEILTPLALSIAHAAGKLDGAQADAAVPVIAADTVVDVDGRSLGKPKHAAEAAEMLRLLSGREHAVHTAVAVALPGDRRLAFSETTLVRFFALREDEIQRYVETGEPMDKAGGYGIQGRAAALVERIEGDFYTVMGFPLARFVRMLADAGFALDGAKRPLPDTRS